VREIRSVDILSVKKSAKQSAREMPGEEVGNGDEEIIKLRPTLCIAAVFDDTFGDVNYRKLAQFSNGVLDELVLICCSAAIAAVTVLQPPPSV